MNAKRRDTETIPKLLVLLYIEKNIFIDSKTVFGGVGSGGSSFHEKSPPRLKVPGFPAPTPRFKLSIDRELKPKLGHGIDVVRGGSIKELILLEKNEP